MDMAWHRQAMRQKPEQRPQAMRQKLEHTRAR